jgi:hypothetical protein
MRYFGLLHVETARWIANHSTQWSRLSLEQLSYLNQSKNLPEFHTTARQLVHILSQMNPIHTLPSYCFKSSCAYEITVDGEKA